VTAVGVLGIGRMGGSMARALAAAGFEVVCWNRTPAAAAELAAELGGRAVRRPADVATAADVCVSMLADGPAVEAVYCGPDGLLAGARIGNVLVDSSTVPPSTIRRLEVAARRAGAGLLDAPVSGSVSLAESGSLTIMVGGEAADLERARPVLNALATTIFHLGPLGTGAAMKLAVNAVVFGLNEALAEGLVLAEAAGIDRSIAYDVLAASAVRSPFIDYKRSAFIDPQATPVAFALDLAAKDLRLISALATELGLALPGAATALAVIAAASAGDRGGRDLATVAEHLRQTARTEEGQPA
jgi:3-hydroxyisobutyrate dehydrogenase-like beta-hydroxyacid dehydrogenase